MPIRGVVAKLPGRVRAELEERLIEANFGGLQEIADWLTGLGYKASKSSVHRYSLEVQARREAIAIPVAQAEAAAIAAQRVLPRFEYRQVMEPGQAELAAMGQERWELVVVTAGRWVFKRQVF